MGPFSKFAKVRSSTWLLLQVNSAWKLVYKYFVNLIIMEICLCIKWNPCQIILFSVQSIDSQNERKHYFQKTQCMY